MASSAIEHRWDFHGSEVLVRQTGKGTPVLLINGLGSHTAMWAPMEQAWDDVHLISFDAPGVGRSENRIPPPDIGALARLSEELLDRLEFEQVDVLGYSMGGLVAQILAHRSPERVRRLVLGATTPGWGWVPGGWESAFHIFTPLRYFSNEYYRRTVGNLAGGQARHDPAFVDHHASERLSGRPTMFGYFSQLAGASRHTSLPWLHEISTPTLVVAGGDDPLVPAANALILAHRIPEARLALYPAEGHLLLFDGRSPALPDIHEFLTAPSIEDSRSWREATVVSAEAERSALRRQTMSMFPWGLLNAAYRSVVSRPGFDAS